MALENSSVLVFISKVISLGVHHLSMFVKAPDELTGCSCIGCKGIFFFHEEIYWRTTTKYPDMIFTNEVEVFIYCS